ncbi:AAA family ATPase, partial [bacterium]|nr:AAA family ATPase [bacterium]
VKEDQRKDYEIFPGTLFYIDISGFTSMSEKLAKIGKEGAEKLAGIINGYFDNFNDIISHYGGDIYRFGGDAIFGFYPDKKEYDSVMESLIAAQKIMDYVDKNHTIEMGNDKFTIKMHIGLAYGNIFFQDLRSDYFLGGNLSYELMDIVDTSKAGEIMVNKEFKKLAKNAKFKKVNDKIYKLMEITNMKLKKKSITIDLEKFPGDKLKKLEKSIQGYLPDWLYKRIQLNPVFNPKDGEHRKIAVLFIHFKGLDIDKNPELAKEIISNFYSNVDKLATKYDAYLNKMDIYKDSARMLIIFGFPYAHEDIYIRATSLAEELMRFSKILRLKIKIGINGGFAFGSPIGNDYRREYTVMGDAVNLAARFAAGAKENTIIVGESIYKKAQKVFDFELLGEKSYKGKSKKIKIYRPMKKKKVQRSVLSKWLSESEKFIGRKKEMEKVNNTIEKVLKKHGQLLGISGQAGLGKSRMTQEILKILKKKEFSIYEGDCLSYGTSLTYHPWIMVLNNYFELNPTDTIEEKELKLKEKIGKISKKLVPWLPIIGEIIGVPFEESDLTKSLDAKLRKQRFFDIILDILKFISKDQAHCIVLDDIHWSDSASMELLNYVARNISTTRILLILVFRPMADKEFMEKKYYTQLNLKPFNKTDTMALVKNLLNIRSFPDELKNLIIQKTQGNPFYTEEIIKSIIEQGFIEKDKKGKWAFTGNVKKLNLPDSIEGVILSRIDRLEIKERDALQIASILGREFDFELLAGVYKHRKELVEIFDNLHSLDIVKKEKTKEITRYFFKHIFTQEVAYDTISFEKRRELHKKVGAYIERKSKKNLQDVLGLLSYHYYRAESYEKSLVFSVEAGDKAKKVYANEEAIEFYTRAIDSYEKLEGKK